VIVKNGFTIKSFVEFSKMDSAKNKFLLKSFGEHTALLPKLSEPKSYLHYVSELIDGNSLLWTIVRQAKSIKTDHLYIPIRWSVTEILAQNFVPNFLRTI